MKAISVQITGIDSNRAIGRTEKGVIVTINSGFEDLSVGDVVHSYVLEAKKIIRRTKNKDEFVFKGIATRINAKFLYVLVDKDTQICLNLREPRIFCHNTAWGMDFKRMFEIYPHELHLHPVTFQLGEHAKNSVAINLQLDFDIQKVLELCQKMTEYGFIWTEKYVEKKGYIITSFTWKWEGMEIELPVFQTSTVRHLSYLIGTATS